MEVNGNEEPSTEVAKCTNTNDNEEDLAKKVINLTVEYQNHSIAFKIKCNTPFAKLFKVYCERMVRLQKN